MKGPRRARSRWLEGAPNYVIDCMYDKKYGEWAALLGAEFSHPEHYQRTGLIEGLSFNNCPTSPNMGMSMFGYYHKDWRRTTKTRIRWLDIPEHLRDHVIRRCS